MNFLEQRGHKLTLIDARFAKPLDHLLLDQIFNSHEYVLTIEEGSIGGFSSAVLNYVHNIKKTHTNSIIKNIIFPDKFVEHNSLENQYKEIGMDAQSITNKVLCLLSDDIISINEYKKNKPF